MNFDMNQLARQVMLSRGLQPDYPPDELQQLATIQKPAVCDTVCTDLKQLLWCSIDNDDSLDLDQLTYGEKDSQGNYTLWIAVADVDAIVKKGFPIDAHAAFNTTSVYTPTKVFAMLPEKLSTNLTSLNENETRLAMVVKIKMDPQGVFQDSSIFRGVVYNYAKLTYSGVGAWLDGGPMPDKIKQVKGLSDTLACQYEATRILQKKIHAHGALTLETAESQAKMSNGNINITLVVQNKAHHLIEQFMIAANIVMSEHMRQAKIPSLRRVVRVPKNWDRIVQLAAECGEQLPEKPDSKALDEFLIKQKHSDPTSFPDLSLSIIKLLGRGEYVVEYPGDRPIGHFGLALPEYAHTTAPNRRFPDLIAQRHYKACVDNKPKPYKDDELQALAEHCTTQEDAATKVERHLNKSAAALLLSKQIGKKFKGIISGAASKGTWVRIFDPPIEGKVIHGFQHLKVGDKVTVTLISVDVPNGFIDFAANS